MSNMPFSFLKTRIACSIISGLIIVGCDSSNTSTNTVVPVPYHLNDTGITKYSSTNAPFVATTLGTPTLSSSTVTDHPGQDANVGRDADLTTNSDVDGRAGFSFTKLDGNGQALVIQSTPYKDQPWDCARDNVTGLVWEVKSTTYTNPRYYAHKYTWFDMDTATNGGNAGSQGEDTLCGKTLTSCNTLEFKNYVNKLNNNKGLCGYTDWRVPNREELRSIVDYGRATSPMIDENFLGTTEGTDHWTSQTALYTELYTEDAATNPNSTYQGSSAWALHFDQGYSQSHGKEKSQVTVRLVRGP